MRQRTGFCQNCGAARQPADVYCGNCGASFGVANVPAPMSGPVAPQGLAPYKGSDPLLSFEIEYPASLSRWKIFVKWLLAIPHYFALYFLGLAVMFVQFIAWFAILFTGNYPRGLWDFNLMVLRWSANVNAYVYLQCDEYPPFGDGPYPVHLGLEYPSSLSRWKIFVKWLFILPSLFVFMFVVLALFVVQVFAFFAILVTGRFPRGAFDFCTGAYRWNYRITAYYTLMTDRYPPFSLD